MSYFFLDSSALIKRYVAEAGSGWIRSTTALSTGNTIVVAQITQIEVISGVSRRKREGVLLPRTAAAVRLLIDRHIKREYIVIALTSAITQHAEDLLESQPVRAYDAVQLASALESNNQLIGAGLAPLIFVSADMRLLSVASAEGLSVDNPQTHP